MTSSAVRTAARVASEIPGRPLRTRLTVASLTPACLATSASFRAILQFYANSCRADRACLTPRQRWADGAVFDRPAPSKEQPVSLATPKPTAFPVAARDARRGRRGALGA